MIYSDLGGGSKVVLISPMWVGRSKVVYKFKVGIGGLIL